MIRQYIANLLRKSPFLRFLALPLLFALFALFLAWIAHFAHSGPKLSDINPSIGAPGEVLVIRGKHFGSDRDDGWVEIAGNRLTASSYITWTDTTIMATLPQTVDDGLINVCTKYGKSNPLIFGNRDNIPVAARATTDSGLPIIEKFDLDKTETGKLLVIDGKNFGMTRGSSEVLFAWQLDQAIPASASTRTEELSVACSERDFDYESWSDQGTPRQGSRRRDLRRRVYQDGPGPQQPAPGSNPQPTRQRENTRTGGLTSFPCRST